VKKNACRGLVGKPEGERTLRRCRRRRVDSIKVDFTEIGLKWLYWINLPQNVDKSSRLVDSVINVWAA
jgi:hypothetical protein